jgi:hypothetical protein
MHWNDIKEYQPLCWETGNWDGKKSSPLLVMDTDYSYYVAECYAEIIDGTSFLDFYTIDGMEIVNVVSWSLIEADEDQFECTDEQ